MPLKLLPPRPGKSPCWSVRGSHLGVPIYQSTKTPEQELAMRVLATIERDIEDSAGLIRSSNTYPIQPPSSGPAREVAYCIYAIRSGEFIKVGISANIERRFEQFHLYNPHSPVIVAVFSVNNLLVREAEARVHKALEAKAAGREWFRATDQEVLDAIQQVLSTCGPAGCHDW